MPHKVEYMVEMVKIEKQSMQACLHAVAPSNNLN